MQVVNVPFPYLVLFHQWGLVLCSNTEKYIDNSVNSEIFRDVLDIKLYQYRFINIIDKSGKHHRY